MPRTVLIFLLLAAMAVTAQPARGQGEEHDALRQRVVALQAELASLRAEYGGRLVALEGELAALRVQLAGKAGPPAEEVPQEPAEAPPPPSREEDDLLAEIQAALRGGAGETPPQPEAPQARIFTGGTRSLRELNPEISVTGDLFGTVSDFDGDPERNQFKFAEFELALQADLDPFSLAKFFPTFEEGEFELEEGYIEWMTLPLSLGAKAGRFRNDFGKLNRWHQHALPQSDRPFVHQQFLGGEGLLGTGLSVSWLPPVFLGDYNELWVQVTNDENEDVFSGRGFDNPLIMAHETNFFDLSESTYLELGLSAITGIHDPDLSLRSTIYGVDFNLVWEPPERARYRSFEFRGEALLSNRETPEGTKNALGGYLYGTYQFDQRWYTGLRLDYAETPEAPDDYRWGFSPYVEWWQSEWARIRLQYQFSDGLTARDEHRLFLQATWSLGPHKHEKY